MKYKEKRFHFLTCSAPTLCGAFYRKTIFGPGLSYVKLQRYHNKNKLARNSQSSSVFFVGFMKQKCHQRKFLFTYQNIGNIQGFGDAFVFNFLEDKGMQR